MQYTENDIQRFWSKVDIKGKNECWEWLNCLQHGYGIITIQDKTYRANRLAYIFTYGEIPEGLFICHKCGNRSCCNPNHLYAGTAKDNYLDTLNAGNFIFPPILDRKGENAPRVKLNKEQVEEIRVLIQKGIKHKEIAKQYSISVSNVSAIGIGRSWNNSKKFKERIKNDSI